MTAPTQTKPASEKQIGLLDKLAGERGVTVQGIANELFEADFDLSTLSGGRFGTASTLITALFAMSRVDGQGTTRVDPDEGLYRMSSRPNGGAEFSTDIVRVVIGASGHWYAQLAVRKPGRASLAWDYLGKRVDLSGAQTLTDAEAGKILGYCVRCNAELTDPDSIARGIGPVCAKKVS